MSLIMEREKNPVSIDRTICNRCGICTRVCIFSVLSQDPATRYPITSDNPDRQCSRCGQCTVFCPTGAIQISGRGGEYQKTEKSVPPISVDQVRSLVLYRRSIRQYLSTPVPKETIEEIIGLLAYVPAVLNLRTIRWQVIHNTNDVHEIAALTASWMESMIHEGSLAETGPANPWIASLVSRFNEGEDLISHGAPHLIVAHSETDAPHEYTNAVIATSYLDLIAPVYGIGTCWAGLIGRAARRSSEIQEVMGIPKGHIPHTVMMIGYPRYTPQRAPGRQPVEISWKE